MSDKGGVTNTRSTARVHGVTVIVHNLLLYDKNNFMRETLRRILRGRFPDLMIRDALTFEECMSVLDGFKPDILLLNLTYHSGDDLDRLRRIREKDPATTIMLLMDYDIDEYRKEAILNGANYIISKDLWTGSEILALIKTILTASRDNDRPLAEGEVAEKDLLDGPIERRNKSRSGKKREEEFLETNRDRRKWY